MNDTLVKLTAELAEIDTAINVVELQTLKNAKIRKTDIVLYKSLQSDREVKREELHQAWQISLAPKKSFWKNPFRMN